MIQSFTSGNVLTIALADGSTVKGLVTRDTRVECQAMSTVLRTHDGGPGPSGGGDNSGQGDRHDQGDDRGDQAGNNDQADDNNANDQADDNDANDQTDDNNANDQADDNGVDDNDADDDNGVPAGQPASCAMALRTTGTHVRDATLRLTGSGPVWQRIDLDA
jgi:hypothetical protein